MTDCHNMTKRCIRGLQAAGPELRGCVLTMGNFDGVHRGHQKIINAARRVADNLNAPVVALTFDPPPEQVLRPDSVTQRISPQRCKCGLLINAGVDFVVTLPTDRELLAKSAADFVDDIVVKSLGASHVVEGYNFFFGRAREGTVEVLEQLGKSRGFTVDVVEPFTMTLGGQDVRVSSTLVRKLVTEGHVRDASQCLGRDFVLYGKVVAGYGRGRKLDYPTANVDPGKQVTPGDGIYAARAQVGGVDYLAAVSIGNNPTFESSSRVIEAFLLNAEGDLYDESLSLGFVERLRDMQRFETTGELRDQIAKDVERVKEICG